MVAVEKQRGIYVTWFFPEGLYAVYHFHCLAYIGKTWWPLLGYGED